MARTVGKAFQISKKAVKNYGYARPGMTPNSPPPVTAIAAVNGRGAYAKRSARAAMQGLSSSARATHARNLTQAQRRAFAQRMRQAKAAKHRSNTDTSFPRSSRYSMVRPAGSGRTPARPRPASAATGGRSMRPNVTAAQRRAALANLKKARSALRGKRKGMSANRARPRKARKSARRSMSRNRKQTPAQRRASLANLRKARAKRGGRKSMRKNRKSTRRKAKRNGRQTAAQRRASLANLRKARAKRGGRKTRRKGMRKNRRQTPAQRRASLANLRKARAKRGGRKHRSNRRRKGMRKNTWYGQSRRHSKASKKGWSRRRGYKANRRSKLFRKNGIVDGFITVFKCGALGLGGFVAHKALTKIFSDFVLSKLIGAVPTPAAPATPVTPPAVQGLEALQDYKGVIAGAVAAGVGIYATDKLVKDVHTKMMLTTGMAVSFLHTLLVTALAKAAPQAVDYLAGYEDGTAARLSAMYGLGGGASILPHYAAINGMGEYFTEGGLGEYFSEPMSGLGEYFSEGMSGLGAYGANPDMYQAAAGYGTVDYANGNHVDPSSDLDRELTIAEAAAGVGALPAYEAAAGMGRVQSYEAAAGMGAIQSVRRADTWIPGMQSPQLWAGVRGISKPQSSTAMVPAGVLQTEGGQGVFG